MSNIEIIILVTILTATIGGILFVVLPLLKAKGYDVVNILKRIETVLNGLNGAIQVVTEIAPKNKFVEILEYIAKYQLLEKAADFAAQLYISGQLSADQRKTTAVNYVINALKILGIEVTPELQKYIEGGIEAIIYAAKTSEEIKAQETKTVQNTTVALQQQVIQLAADKAQLKSTNQQLTQQIANIKSTVAAQ